MTSLSEQQTTCSKRVHDDSSGLSWPCAGPSEHWGGCSRLWPASSPQEGAQSREAHQRLRRALGNPECPVHFWTVDDEHLLADDLRVLLAEPETALLARIATLEAERDRAREECGHQKAMRESISTEMTRWVQMHIRCKREHEGAPNYPEPESVFYPVNEAMEADR